MSEAEVEVHRPSRVMNRAYHALGLGILAANYLRHRIRGYRTPRPQAPDGVESALAYDRAVVENWVSHLRRYLRSEPDFKDKTALEIGPGLDLGTGLVMLARGLGTYIGLDVHPLLERCPPGLHQRLAQAIAESEEVAPEDLAQQWERLEKGDPDRLLYLCQQSLDLSSLRDASVDLVVSHAVFEHLDDVNQTLGQLGRVARSGALLVSEIDLQTHTRWIRDADPLNIYRYREQLYRSLRFSGAPNRVRPDEYIEALENHGWIDPRMYPRRVLDTSYVRRVEPTLARRFRGDPERLGWLSVVICATRSKGKRS